MGSCDAQAASIQLLVCKQLYCMICFYCVIVSRQYWFRNSFDTPGQAPWQGLMPHARDTVVSRGAGSPICQTVLTYTHIPIVTLWTPCRSLRSTLALLHVMWTGPFHTCCYSLDSWLSDAHGTSYLGLSSREQNNGNVTGSEGIQDCVVTRDTDLGCVRTVPQQRTLNTWRPPSGVILFCRLSLQLVIQHRAAVP